MARYIAGRVAWAAVASFVILTVTFVLLWITPDPQVASVQLEAAQSGGNAEEAVETYQIQRGLDEPVYVQYFDYLRSMATLDWGWSETNSMPVTQAIAEAIPYSLMYAVPSLVISTLLGLLIGLYSATHQYTKKDYAATFFAFFGLSIPDFWFAIILLVVFGSLLNWVPILFDPNVAVFSFANAQQLVLPVVVLTLSSIAGLMRYSRAEALEYVEADFVKTARAKGVSERRVLYRHIFRPASVPLATILVGDILTIVLASSYLIEVVFGIPGLGKLSFDAIVNQDTELVLGTVLVPAFLVILSNLAQDIAYTVLDPRIDYGDR